MTHKDVLRYGHYLYDNTINTEEHCYRIRLIAVDTNLYYSKMCDGEVVEFRNLSEVE